MWPNNDNGKKKVRYEVVCYEKEGKWLLKFYKGTNLKMIFGNYGNHIVSVLKKSLPLLNEVVKSTTKCINSVKCNAKWESSFKKFDEDKNAVHITLLRLRYAAKEQ